jgi:hypothetical protein
MALFNCNAVISFVCGANPYRSDGNLSVALSSVVTSAEQLACVDVTRRMTQIGGTKLRSCDIH